MYGGGGRGIDAVSGCRVCSLVREVGRKRKISISVYTDASIMVYIDSLQVRRSAFKNSSCICLQLF